MIKISNITVLGAGVLGTQIAFQAAFKGFKTVLYDIDAVAFDRAMQLFQILAKNYMTEGNASREQITATLGNLSYSSDLEDAVKDADLIIESVPEDINIKAQIYQSLSRVAPEKSIFATNTSTFLPSKLMDYTGRPHKFLALHFANNIFKHNLAEIMGSSETDPEVFSSVSAFAKEMGMEPIEIKKEKAGYILNSILIPFLSSASVLLMEGVSDIESIDKAWRIATQSPLGPFEIYDAIGINTIYNIAKGGDMKSKMFAYYLKENYIKQGKLGIETGEGFYKYPKE